MPLPSLQGQPQVSHLSAAMITYRMTISRANVTSASRLMREFSCNFTPCLRSGREALGHTGKDRRVGGRATAAGGACREVASVRQSRPVSLGGAGIALPMAGIPGLSPRPGYHRCAAHWVRPGSPAGCRSRDAADHTPRFGEGYHSGTGTCPEWEAGHYSRRDITFCYRLSATGCTRSRRYVRLASQENAN